MSNLAAQELQSFVRRIENLDDEIRALNTDKSEVFKEVKSSGFTAKTVRKVVAARRLDAADRDEADTEFELYWNAVHGIEIDHVRAHVENIEQFDADGVEIEPQSAPQAAQMRAGTSTALVTSPAGVEGIVDRQPIRPETANDIPDEPTDGGPHESAAHRSVNPIVGANQNHDLTGHAVGDSHHEVASTSAHIVTGEGARDASVTTLRQPKPLRPNCLKPDACGGQGRQHCYSCQKAMNEAGAA